MEKTDQLRLLATFYYVLAVAGMETIFMPFGKILGVFTIIALVQKPTNALFATES